jgi:hypothetical protein
VAGAAVDLGELVFGAGELIFRPSASPSQPSRSASAMRAVRLSRISAMRGTLGGAWPVQGAAQHLCSWMHGGDQGLRRCSVSWLPCLPGAWRVASQFGRCARLSACRRDLRFLPAALDLGGAQRAAKPRCYMAAAALHRVTLLVSDFQVLLVSDPQDVLRPMAPGSTEITRACRVPAQPYQAGRGLILTASRYDGSLVVLEPSMGDLRAAYRFLAPALRVASHRVACTDLRGHGHGDSDATFTPTATRKHQRLAAGNRAGEPAQAQTCRRPQAEPGGTSATRAAGGLVLAFAVPFSGGF